MQTANDTILLNQIDPRLRAVVLMPEQSGDRACLLLVLKLAAAAPTAEKRDAIFAHFEKTIAHGLRNHVAQLRSVYADVEASLTESPAKKRLAAIKAKAAERGLL